MEFQLTFLSNGMGRGFLTRLGHLRESSFGDACSEVPPMEAQLVHVCCGVQDRWCYEVYAECSSRWVAYKSWW